MTAHVDRARRSRTGKTNRLRPFDKPPFIIFEWEDLTYTWFSRPYLTRHLAEALVAAGVPVVFVPRPEKMGKADAVTELEQLQFGIWCCPAWRLGPEGVHGQLQRLEQLFPASPWLFRHPDWLALVKTDDRSRRLVVYDGRSQITGQAIRADTGFPGKHFGAFADLVVTDSLPGLIRWSRLNERTFYLRPLTRAKLPAQRAGADLERIPRPRLIVLNEFAEMLDVELITFIAEQRPDWSIVIVGRSPAATISWTGHGNIHYLGDRLYFERLAYMQRCDVGLIPLKHSAETRLLSPASAREYGAAGLPVVATFLPDLLAGHGGQVRIACDYSAFVEAIHATLYADHKALRGNLSAPRAGDREQYVEELIRVVYEGGFEAWKEACYESLVAGYYTALKEALTSNCRHFLLREEAAEAAYACRQYEDVLALGSPEWPVYGSALVRLGEKERARQWLQRVLSTTRSGDESLVEKLDSVCLDVYILLLHGELAEGLRMLGVVEARNPVYQLLAARAWFHLGFSDQAAFLYGDVIHESEGLLQAVDYVNIGDIMLENARFRDAEQAYLQAALLGGGTMAQERLAQLYQRPGFGLL